MTISRRAFGLGIGAALGASRAVAAEGLTPDTVRRVDEACGDLIDRRLTAGLMVYASRGSQALFAKGYGSANLETSASISPETVFRVGSITKQFTAASVLLLSEAGALSLDDPLSRFLPDFPRAAEVQIRRLLNHTSGIANITQGVVPFVDYSTQQLVDVIKHQNPLYLFDPGTRWSYSNTGFNVASAVIEHVAGKPYWQFFADDLFPKAGLTVTAADKPADIVPHRASGYTISADAPSGFVNAMVLSWTIPGAAGCLRSNVLDLARWHDALFHGRVLGAKSVAAMTTPARLVDGKLASTGRSGPAEGSQPVQEYGLGLELSEVGGYRRFGHYGSIPGFGADMGTFPDLGVTVVMLSNTDFSAENPPHAVEGILLSDPFVAKSSGIAAGKRH